MENLITALAEMALAYFISVVAKTAATSLAESGKHSFLVSLLVFVHYICAFLSLFVGLFFYLYNDSNKSNK